MKQYSEACEENKAPILAVLRREFSGCRRILEIGSGTGQHAVYFAQQLPDLVWQPSDVAVHLPSINAWREEAGLDNVLPPLILDVTAREWPQTRYDGLFSANTSHIMSWDAVQTMFEGIGNMLVPGGIFCLYGPFNYKGQYTSASNERFDRFLKDRDPYSGIRDFRDLDLLAVTNGLKFRTDHEMPVNNRLLVWERCR